MLCSVKSSNEGFLVHEGQVKNMSSTRYTTLIWLPKSTNHMKYQRCRNDLHTVATRGKTSGVELHVWPKRPKNEYAYATTYIVCNMKSGLKGPKG